MCNEKNVQDAINIMERAQKFSMHQWQEVADGSACETEAELNECGMAACFGGYIAVSPEFKVAGGRVDLYSGVPILGRENGYFAIAEYLDIDFDLASRLTACNKDEVPFYNKSLRKVTNQDVIEKLKLILSGELS